MRRYRGQSQDSMNQPSNPPFCLSRNEKQQSNSSLFSLWTNDSQEGSGSDCFSGSAISRNDSNTSLTSLLTDYNERVRPDLDSSGHSSSSVLGYSRPKSLRAFKAFSKTHTPLHRHSSDRTFNRLGSNCRSIKLLFEPLFAPKSSVEKLNYKGILCYRKEEYARAITFFEQALDESLKALPKDLCKRVRRRSLTHSNMPKSSILKGKKLHSSTSKRFYDGVEFIRYEESPLQVVSSILFNIAQAKRQNKDHHGALESYQRSFFMIPHRTNEVFASTLNNVSLIFERLVGPADTIFLFDNCLGSRAVQWLLTRHMLECSEHVEYWSEKFCMSGELSS
mmetsp:Transcript_3622/g.5302  ORF Transcript_3622/g.5302 Transcript_3622/m.5302 type:complete len:336 (+) Transcript_3622:75-1082(+)